MKKLILASVFCFGGVAASFAAEPWSRSDAGHVATVTWRLHDDWWEDDARFAKLLAFFDEHHLTGKIALFFGHNHSPQPLASRAKDIPILKRRLAAFKARGFRAGVNCLCTVGQTDEEVSSAAVVPGSTLFTDAHGRTSRTCHCANDPVWREQYVKPLYKMLATTEPDFIWTDDDFRLLGHGGEKGTCRGCFCRVCLERLRQRLGYDGKDVSGLNAFFTDPAKGEVRRRGLLQLNRETRASLMTYIRDTIWSVNPKIVLGAMDGPTQWHNGNDWPELYQVMSPNGQECFFRPGGGFYSDVNALDALLNKANEMGLEGARMPDAVRCCESEIESFNYRILEKSTAALRTEVLTDLVAGTRGTALNILPFARTDELTAFGARVDGMEALRPTADAIVAAAGTARPRGVWDGRTRDFEVGENAGGRDGEWLDPRASKLSRLENSLWNSDLQRAGIPVAYREQDAVVCAPSADTVWCWTKSELERRLAGGLYLSAEVVQAFVDRGYGAEVGFTVGRRFTEDANERYVEHPLTTGLTPYLRDLRLSFFGGEVYELLPLKGASVSGRVETLSGKVFAPCCAGTFVNARGGRIYAQGAMPYGRLATKPGQTHLRRVFDWLAGGALPGRLDSTHRAVLWLRGNRLAGVLNMSLDPAENVVLLLNRDLGVKQLRCVTEKSAVITGTPSGPYVRFVLPRLAPWSVAAFAPADAARGADKVISRRADGAN